ncbi:hypothetical protein CMO88_02275 [Candidatus Woesearchaeota archaeon]|nr:hypothetical protein [Candidatus Woesearchaeota archaeon]|tara:strand:- start:15248 stop:15535 length:288 start_codon:yes stop_codon:yes gene_type:complete
MYDLGIKPEVDKIFKKLANKNPNQLRIINKKLLSIREHPQHEYKFLRKPFQTFNRVHIDKHFVLIFKINHKDKVVDVYYYDHHDKVYQWRDSENS